MSENIKIISQNKKARFNYFLSDFLEAGIVLSGTEIKSIRLHNVNLDDAITKYTQAMSLAKECSEKLKNAEEVVNKILTENNTLEDFKVEE